MTSLPYNFTKEALVDLEEIWLYTAGHWGIKQADRYYQLIMEEIDHICKNFESGRSMYEIRKGYRASKVKSHINFYKVVDETVMIIRILHERMDMVYRLD